MAVPTYFAGSTKRVFISNIRRESGSVVTHPLGVGESITCTITTLDEETTLFNGAASYNGSVSGEWYVRLTMPETDEQITLKVLWKATLTGAVVDYWTDWIIVRPR
jgi:hypothetical protein